MITKGIVEEIVDYKAKVRLPIYDDVPDSKIGTKINNLSSATICSICNIQYPVSVGDIVYVGFEDNDNNKPIILGHLYRKIKTNTTPGLTLGLLTTTSTTKLNEDTYIGNITPNEIRMLTGVQSNIQLQINNINDKLNKDINIDVLEQKIDAEQQRALAAEANIKNTYLPLTGGSISGDLLVGNNLSFNFLSDSASRIILDLIYPIGIVIEFVNSVNPNDIMKGQV
ncbi:hypothetical protein [uncultured Clostridium sp.]|uniref:hypothetical protein n=1 Tax=uncultured Clostridium sp. TaxID=59620 RepID=UPI00261AC89D|nr:hypothetical protein [uncultured Clostridium sp.]